MTITTGGGVSAFLSAPAPPSPKLHVNIINKHTTYPNKLQMLPLIQSKSHPLKTIALQSSTSSASFVEDPDGGNDSSRGERLQSESETTAQEQDSTVLPSVSVRDGSCKACGREEMEAGCNGEGRIQGGIATVAGFGWWPIKAYRPCPAYLATGGRYKRRGQTMDEVTSGRIARAAAAAVVDDAADKTSKGPKKKVSL